MSDHATTLREVAEKVVDELPPTVWGYKSRERYIQHIERAIKESVAAEREACAKVALAYELPETNPQDQHGRVMASLQIAAAIRSRTAAEENKDV